MLSTVLFLSALLLTSAFANECQDSFSAQLCDEIEKGQDLIVAAVTDANEALIDGFVLVAERYTEVSKLALDYVKTGLRIKVQDRSEVLRGLNEILREAEGLQGSNLQNGQELIKETLSTVQILLQQDLLEILSSGSQADNTAVAFSLDFNTVIASVRAKLQELLKSTSEKLKLIVEESISKAIESGSLISLVQKLFTTLDGKIDPKVLKVIQDLMGPFIQDIMKRVVDEKLKKLLGRYSLAVGVAATIAEDVELDAFVKYNAFLDKIKEAVTRVGGKLVDSVQKRTLEVLAKNHGKIMDALKSLGHVLIDTGKEIVKLVTNDMGGVIVSEVIGG